MNLKNSDLRLYAAMIRGEAKARSTLAMGDTAIIPLDETSLKGESLAEAIGWNSVASSHENLFRSIAQLGR